MSKYNFKNKSVFNGKSNANVINSSFYYGIVVDVDDPFDMGHIKVRIRGIDDQTNTVDLPNTFPLLPKFFSSKPKINEVVLVFTQENDNPYVDRFYLGPLISQPQLSEFSDLTSAKNGLDSGAGLPLPAPSKIPESKGVYNVGEDIVVRGRENADIALKKDEILIRTGAANKKIKIKGVPTFNSKNQGYIQIRSNYKPMDSTKTISLMNIVASKINLLTHEDGSPLFNLHDQNSTISDAEILNILKTAHPAVFGDLLVEYLLLMRSVILNHVHAYPGMKAQNLNGESDITKLLEYDLKSIVSKNIKLN